MKSEIVSKTTEHYLPSRKHLPIIIIVCLMVALAIRLIFALTAQHPGHGDQAFYLTLAENLADGRGFEIDYIWNYLSQPENIPCSSNDYWMPLTAVIISLSLSIFGKSLIVALLPSILFGLALSVIVYYIGKIYLSSRFVTYYSATIVLFIPTLFKYSLLTDSTIFYAVFVSSSLLFMTKGMKNSRYFLLSAICACLAHLTRQDGVLLVPTLIAVILISPHRRKTKYMILLISMVLYIVILLPLLIDNYKTFGALFPSGPLKTIFLTEYEDIYSYSKEISLRTYIAWGLPNILLSKIKIGLYNIKTLLELSGYFLWIFFLIGIFEIVISKDKKRQIYLPPLLYLVLLFGFYSLIATFPSSYGGFYRSAMSLIPFLLVISMDTIWRHIPSKQTVFLIVILITAIFMANSIYTARKTIIANSEMNQQLTRLKDVLQSDIEADSDAVIMTRGPWEVFYTTGYKTIQIPNEDIDIIYEVALRYGADYLLLPAPRQALEDIYRGTQVDARFELIADIKNSDLKLYYITKPN